MNAKGALPYDPEPPALEALLRWYVAMGVDAPIDEAPHNRFEQPERPVAARPPARPHSDAAPPTSADALIVQAEVLAAGAETLEDLRMRWATLPGCPLAGTAARMIFAGGTPGARLMIVGGAPDTDDERQGEAFSGANGRLLDAMLRAIALDRTQVYLAHIIPWRPPGNRQPTPLELGLCLPFARRHIALAAPDILVCLGERAAQPLLGSRDPISRLRGRWLSFEGKTTTVKTLATFALDYLAKQPLQKRRAWADLLMLASALGDDGAAKPMVETKPPETKPMVETKPIG